MRRNIAWLACLILVACSRGEPRSAQPPVAPPTVGLQSSLDSLLGALGALKGAFPRQGPPGIGDFSGDRSLLSAIVEHGDSAVVRLVECMARTEPTVVTKGSRTLTLGELCYAVLVNTAYYEATDAEGDVSANWPGDLDLPATPAQIQAAKQAWDSVVARRAYHLL